MSKVIKPKKKAKKVVVKTKTVSDESKLLDNKFIHFYDKNYKILLLIPFILLIASLLVLGVSYVTNGSFIDKGVSLKGGVTATIFGLNSPININTLKSSLESSYPNSDVTVRELTEKGVQSAIIIEVSDLSSEKLEEHLETKYSVSRKNLSMEEMGSSLGDSFFKQIITAIIVSFIFMGIVVFMYFRIPIPSLAVILAAFSDIIVTMAVCNLIGLKLSTAGIAAFLMLIGYSVDTDILLSTRVLKNRKTSILGAIISAAKTGLTTNVTTLVAVTIGYFFSQSVTLRQIFLIIIIGLLIDIVNTWIQNAGLLRWYLESKEKKVKGEYK